MSSMFSITSMLPSHLAIEMSIVLRVVVEILSTEILGTEISGAAIFITTFGTLFGALAYRGIEQNLGQYTGDANQPSLDNLRPDWTTVCRKHHHPRSTRDGFTPALA